MMSLQTSYGSGSGHNSVSSVGVASLSSAGPLSPASEPPDTGSDLAGMSSPIAASGTGPSRGGGSGGGGGGGGSGSIFRATMLLCGVLMAAMSTVLAVSCTAADVEPSAAIVIYIPAAIQLGQLLRQSICHLTSKKLQQKVLWRLQSFVVSKVGQFEISPNHIKIR